MMSEPKVQQEPSMEEILASIRRIISEDGTPETNKAQAASAQEADILDLTEVVEEPRAAAAPVEDASPAEDDGIELREEAPPPPPKNGATDNGGLVSPPAAGSATSMLAGLVQAVDAGRSGTPIGQGNRTIEDLVKEVMRPMIKSWLDAHLPGLVERLVRREIERLSHHAEGD